MRMIVSLLVVVGIFVQSTFATAPILSAIGASPVNDTWAMVNWTTDIGANSYVDYGLTSSYGNTEYISGYITAHHVQLNNLTAGTTYHYRIRSTNSSGETTPSGDYTFTTGAATYGCESNPTGEPLGGGAGYSRIYTPEQANYLVGTTAELNSAITNATTGMIIYVRDDAMIDMSGYKELILKAGVTLASGRGRNGSPGGMIYTNTFTSSESKPFIKNGGTGVRITGLRLVGPFNGIGRTVPMYHGIYAYYGSFEIDNCELTGFNYAHIEATSNVAGPYVHHCYIHHNTRTGVGYGVCPGWQVGIVEGNIFDYHRHAVAASGRPGMGYEARYNLVFEHSVSHIFDMHGAADFEKNIEEGKWRFDESSGSTADDSSEYGGNNATLYNFSSPACWVTGKINKGLQFDGTNDYVSAGARSNLAGSNFSVVAWIKPTAVSGTQAIVSKGTSTATGYGYSLRLVGSSLEGMVYNSSGTQYIVTGGTISAGVWTHVGMTFNGSYIRIYVNGTQANYKTCTSVLQSSSYNFIIGKDSAGSTSYFNGVIDEVRCYSSALAAADVLRHYNLQGDIAGDTIRIHHNTVRNTDDGAVCIRGIPATGAWINNNWFFRAHDSWCIRQENATGNFYLGTNIYGPGTPTLTGHAPTLTWTDEANYTSGAVYPQSGASSVAYTFRVKYTDVDGDPPMAGFPRLHLKRNSEEFTYFAPLTMFPIDSTTVMAGRIYSCTLKLPRGSDYSYSFECFDTIGNAATGVGAGTTAGPTITGGNSTPVLFPPTNSSSYVDNCVTPSSGNSNTVFDYRVAYIDIDNDPPAAGFPKVRIYNSSGAEVIGSPFTMTAMESTQYANGRHYRLQKKLPYQSGNYRYQMIATDSQGAAAVSVPASITSYPAVSNGSTVWTDVFTGAPNPNLSMSFSVAVSFGQSVTDFTSSDVSVTNGSISDFTGSGAFYSFTVAAITEGTVAVSVPAGMTSPSNLVSSTINRVCYPSTGANDIWIGHGYTSSYLGTQDNPFNLISDGIGWLKDGGTMHFLTGSNPETIRITKPMSIHAEGGTARVGSLSGVPAPQQ